MSRSNVTGFAVAIFFTFTGIRAFCPLAATVMTASPSPTGVTTPAALTTATPGLLVV